jgi:ATP-dependent protease ClpP protease subunit
MSKNTANPLEAQNRSKKRVDKLLHKTDIKKKEEKVDTEKNVIGYSLDWNRAIYINKAIDDALLKELTPVILKMKQESSEPITVGIDSLGGSPSVVNSILGLLKSPDQDGKITEIYTASTNRAFSAAASFLAFGDYAVAYPHSQILLHDLRYIELEDVTPTKALKTARELERGNTDYSLKLAEHITRRLVWAYIDLKQSFDSVRKRWSGWIKKYDDAFEECFTPAKGEKRIDVVGFSLALYQNLSKPIDNDIAIEALKLLNNWIQLEKIENSFSKEINSDNKKIDIIQGIEDLIVKIRRMENNLPEKEEMPEIDQSEVLDDAVRNDFKLLIKVLARRYAIDKDLKISDDGLDNVREDLLFIKNMTSTEQISKITTIMKRHSSIFFDAEMHQKLEGAINDKEREEIMAPMYPQARLLWFYIVLICRCLYRGEHLLSPSDAQLLGLVDEVLGGGPIQSLREWRKTNYK